MSAFGASSTAAGLDAPAAPLPPPHGERERMFVQAALAEAGYPDSEVTIVTHPDHGQPSVCVDWLPPSPVVWRAFTLIDERRTLACFECWQVANRRRAPASCDGRGLALVDCGCDRSDGA